LKPSKCIWISFCLCFWADTFADYSDHVELSQHSDLACGEKIRSRDVKLINLRELLNDKARAVAKVFEEAPDHGLESSIPILIEKAHVDGKVRRETLFRDAVRESATRGCDLVIVLDVEIVEKVMFRPQLMELKLPVSYVLALFGSQTRNSARHNQNALATPDLTSDR